MSIVLPVTHAVPIDAVVLEPLVCVFVLLSFEVEVLISSFSSPGAACDSEAYGYLPLLEEMQVRHGGRAELFCLTERLSVYANGQIRQRDRDPAALLADGADFRDLRERAVPHGLGRVCLGRERKAVALQDRSRGQDCVQVFDYGWRTACAPTFAGLAGN